MEDRANALLTKAQREALREGGEGEYTRQYRQRIRERTRNGTLDLSLLFERMEQKDIKRTFGPDLGPLEELRDIANQMGSTITGRKERHELIELRDELAEYTEVQSESRSQTDTQLNSFAATAPADEDYMESEISSHLNRLISMKREVLDDLHDIESRFNELSRSDMNQPTNKRANLNGSTKNYFEQLWDLLDELIEVTEYELADLKESASLIEGGSPEDVQDVQEIVNEMAQSVRARHRRGGGRHGDVRTLASTIRSIRSIRSEIEEHIENATFASGMKEHVTKSLAFYLRISEVLGADTESIAREALLRTHQHQYPDRTIGDVSVEVSSANRTKASRRAIEQLQGGERWLDVTELRALAETNPAELRKLVETEDITENEIRNAVLARPDSIEEDLEIVDEQPRVTGDGRVPDMVGRDRDGKLVLIELKRSLEDVDKKITDWLGELINEYGGPERARAVVVYPAETAGQASAPRSDAANLEFVPIRVRFD